MKEREKSDHLEEIARSLKNIISSLQSMMTLIIKISKDKHRT